jgi:hypothetical protein
LNGLALCLPFCSLPTATTVGFCLFPDQGYQFGFDRRLILSPVNPPFNAVATDDVLAANTTAWYFA